jgi:hypothetical protein
MKKIIAIIRRDHSPFGHVKIGPSCIGNAPSVAD